MPLKDPVARAEFERSPERRARQNYNRRMARLRNPEKYRLKDRLRSSTLARKEWEKSYHSRPEVMELQRNSRRRERALNPDKFRIAERLRAKRPDRKRWAYEYQRRPEVVSRRKKRYAENREKYRAIAKAWDLRNPDKIKSKSMRASLERQKTGYSKDKALQRAYGITLAQRQEMIAAQNGLCAICVKRPAIAIDHCHSTNKIRGVLCKQCNHALGLFYDDPDVMRAAANYIDRHKSPVFSNC